MTQPPHYPQYPQDQLPPPAMYGRFPAVPPAPPQGGTNGFAIASLVLGIIGGCGLSIIFGIVALRQIKRRNQQGRGMAIAGIVLGCVWGVAVVGLTAASLAGQAERDESGTISDSGSVLLEDLQVGDCLESVTTGKKVMDVPAVPCSEPHRVEIYAVADLPGGDYPGADTVQERVENRCLRELRRTVPAAIKDDAIGVAYFDPTEFSWGTGDRTFVCMLTTEQPTTGAYQD